MFVYGSSVCVGVVGFSGVCYKCAQILAPMARPLPPIQNPPSIY